MVEFFGRLVVDLALEVGEPRDEILLLLRLHQHLRLVLLLHAVCILKVRMHFNDLFYNLYRQ